MGKALLIVVAVALLVYAFFDLLATPSWRVRRLPKPLWFLVILVPVAGPLLWVFLGTSREPRPPSPPSGGVHSGHPIGPDDDPDYLRNL